MTINGTGKTTLSIFVVAMFLTLACAHASGLQLTNLPKYDIAVTVMPDTVDAGARTQVTSHVVLIYYPPGSDPSVPDIYVEYEIKGPDGDVTTAASGYTDKQGYHSADITVPSKTGEYRLIVSAYDIPGGSINGQNESYFTVKAGPSAAVTRGPETPTAVPPVATPEAGGLPLGMTELLIIGAVILALLIVLLVIVALAAFLLLRRKRKPAPAKPVEPVALPGRIEPPPSSRFCMHCGSPMTMEASQCPKCRLTPPSGVDAKQCSTCETVIPESAMFCYHCGARQPEMAKPQQPQDSGANRN